MEKKFSSLMTASNVKVGGVDFVADVMNNPGPLQREKHL